MCKGVRACVDRGFYYCTMLVARPISDVYPYSYRSVADEYGISGQLREWKQNSSRVMNNVKCAIVALASTEL